MNEDNDSPVSDSPPIPLQNLTSGPKVIQPPVGNQSINEPRIVPAVTTISQTASIQPSFYQEDELSPQTPTYQTPYRSKNEPAATANYDYIPGGIFLLGGLMVLPFLIYCYLKLLLLIAYGPASLLTSQSLWTTSGVSMKADDAIMTILSVAVLIVMTVSGVMLFMRARAARLAAIVALSAFILLSIKPMLDVLASFNAVEGIVSASVVGPIYRVALLNAIVQIGLPAIAIVYLSRGKVRDFLS